LENGDKCRRSRASRRRCSEGSQGIHPLDQFALKPAASRERRTDSSPQILLVVIDAMPVEKSPVLFLEGLPAVMFALPLNVAKYVGELGLAYSEGTVAVLPGKGTSPDGECRRN